MSEELIDKTLASTPGILGKIDVVISKIEAIILATGVILMAINTVANVVSRALLGESLHFSEEVNRILIVMITFAGLGYAARHGRHIRMSAIYDMLPIPAKRAMMIIICICTAVIMFMLCYFSVGYIQSLHKTGRLLPSLAIPIYWMYLWVPIGFAVTGVQYAMTAIKNFTADDVYLSTDVVDGYADTETEV